LKVEGDLRSPRGSFQLFLRDTNDEENIIILALKTSLQTEPRRFFKNFIVTDAGRFSEKNEAFDIRNRVYKPEFIQEYEPVFSMQLYPHKGFTWENLKKLEELSEFNATVDAKGVLMLSRKEKTRIPFVVSEGSMEKTSQSGRKKFKV
jgi:hypothetical protein